MRRKNVLLSKKRRPLDDKYDRVQGEAAVCEPVRRYPANAHPQADAHSYSYPQADAYTYQYTDSYPHSDAYSYADAHPYAHADTEAICVSYADSHKGAHRDTDLDTDVVYIEFLQ